MGTEIVRYDSGGVQVQPALNVTLSGFNVLGNLGRVIGEVVLYRIEARRSQARLRELQLKVDVVSRIIDAHTRSELVELDLRARALDEALSLAGAELAQRAQTVDALIMTLRSSDEQIFALISVGTHDDRRLAMEMKVEIAKLLADFTLASTQGTRDALTAVQNLAARPSADLVRHIQSALGS